MNRSNKISRSTDAVLNPDAYKAFKAAGFDAVDMNEFARVMSLDDEEKVRTAVECAKNTGLEIDQCHAPMAETFENMSDDDIERKIKRIEASVRIADKLGIKYTVVHPFIYSWSVDDPDIERTNELNFRYLKRVLNCCNNTELCLENLPGKRGYLRYADEMKKFTDEFKNLGVCIDTGHAFSVNEKISAFFDALGEKIKVLHIHDTIPGYDLHLVPMLGRGDWDDFKQATRNFKGNFNAECHYLTQNELRLDELKLEVNILKYLRD